MVRGHILTQDTRWAAVGKTLMCRPISAMSAWALSRPMPVTSSRRFTAGSTGAAGPVPAWGPVVPSAFTPWAAGMAAISSSIQALTGRFDDHHVDLVQQHPGQLGVVVIEPAGQRLDQGGTLGLHLPALIGEHLRVALPADQRLDHVPHRQRADRAGDG